MKYSSHPILKQEQKLKLFLSVKSLTALGWRKIPLVECLGRRRRGPALIVDSTKEDTNTNFEIRPTKPYRFLNLHYT